MPEKFFFNFVTDGAHNMIKSSDYLSVNFHIICIAHTLHNIIKEIINID
jgi:hypothetical protein